MTHPSRTLLSMGLMLVTVLLPYEARSQCWGVSIGPSYVFQSEWALGYRLAGRVYRQTETRLRYGIDAAAELWRPTDDNPHGVGAEWEGSGAAWLFEVGPIVRMLTGEPGGAGGRLVLQGGAGIVIVSSDAKLIETYMLGLSKPIDLMDSQTAPYVEIGIGAVSRDYEPSIELLAKTRAFFVNPETTVSISFELGVNF